MHLVDASHRGVDRCRITDVALDELDIALDAGEATQRAPRIIVEHAYALACLHQRA